MKDFTLLVIDAQQDFCLPTGSLYVDGADGDMQRLGGFIKKHQSHISQIISSLDAHYNYQIFHPSYWLDKNGLPPKPYTTITLEDLKNGTYTTSDTAALGAAKWYLSELSYSNKYQLIIWPYHCVLGTAGFNLHPAISEAYASYEIANKTNINFIIKGNCQQTEHYSLFRAEVPIDDIAESQLNTTLLASLATKENIVVGGEAFDYCVYVSLLDLMDYVEPRKITVLSDATSVIDPVLANRCREFLSHKGVNFATCDGFKID